MSALLKNFAISTDFQLKNSNKYPVVSFNEETYRENLENCVRYFLGPHSAKKYLEFEQLFTEDQDSTGKKDYVACEKAFCSVFMNEILANAIEQMQQDN